MKTFDFQCSSHPEAVISIQARRRQSISPDSLKCPSCGTKMESFFGNVSTQVNLSGPNWPKRDIKECAYRMRRSKELKQRQKETWDHRMPKLNLDPDVQKEYKDKVLKLEETAVVKA